MAEDEITIKLAGPTLLYAPVYLAWQLGRDRVGEFDCMKRVRIEYISWQQVGNRNQQNKNAVVKLPHLRENTIFVGDPNHLGEQEDRSRKDLACRKWWEITRQGEGGGERPLLLLTHEEGMTLFAQANNAQANNAQAQNVNRKVVPVNPGVQWNFYRDLAIPALAKKVYLRGHQNADNQNADDVLVKAWVTDLFDATPEELADDVALFEPNNNDTNPLTVIDYAENNERAKKVVDRIEAIRKSLVEKWKYAPLWLARYADPNVGDLSRREEDELGEILKRMAEVWDLQQCRRCQPGNGGNGEPANGQNEEHREEAN